MKCRLVKQFSVEFANAAAGFPDCLHSNCESIRVTCQFSGTKFHLFSTKFKVASHFPPKFTVWLKCIQKGRQCASHAKVNQSTPVTKCLHSHSNQCDNTCWLWCPQPDLAALTFEACRKVRNLNDAEALLRAGHTKKLEHGHVWTKSDITVMLCQ